uniref:FERM domain-containing protein n=1 Tax=Caenorhabditis japonica TaxID=281687 RepID=A0A8R1IIE5_CAEJA
MAVESLQKVQESTRSIELVGVAKLKKTSLKNFFIVPLFMMLLVPQVTTRLTPATADTYALLASFVAQIEFGDAPAQVNDEYEKFIVGARLVPTEHSNAEVSRTERTDGFGGGDFVPGPLATVNLQEDEGPRHSEKKSRQLRRTLT